MSTVWQRAPSPKVPYSPINSFSQFPLTDSVRRASRQLDHYLLPFHHGRDCRVATHPRELLWCRAQVTVLTLFRCLITMQAPLIRTPPPDFKYESICFAGNDRPLVTARYLCCCLLFHVSLLHVQTMKREHHRRQQTHFRVIKHRFSTEPCCHDPILAVWIKYFRRFEGRQRKEGDEEELMGFASLSRISRLCLTRLTLPAPEKIVWIESFIIQKDSICEIDVFLMKAVTQGVCS